MKQIILDLLDYSRASKSLEGKEDVDLNEILSEFKQLRRKIISENQLKSNDSIMYTYKVAIMQTLHCLLDNALYGSRYIPKIEINAVEKKKEWEFSIEDNGIGIDSQFFDKIFVIFKDYTTMIRTGIGLPLLKNM
jgi:light-regulated signal transduction histidine kinase (bacteriophytochrome)